MARDKKDQSFGGLLDDIISEALQQEDELLGPIEFCREILGMYLFPAQRVIMKSFYGLPLGKGKWLECINPDDPNRLQKLAQWGHGPDDEFDEQLIMDNWIAEKKAIWVPGQRYKNLSLESGMGSSKCLSLALTSIKGRGFLYQDEYLPSNVSEETIVPLSVDVHTRFGFKRTAAGISRPSERVINLRTRFGYEVGGSVVHPILVFTKDGEFAWKKLPDVKVGDVLCVERNHAGFGTDKPIEFQPKERKRKVNPYKLPTHMSPELGRILGYLVGDGGVNQSSSIVLTSMDQSLIEDYCQIFEKQFGVKPTVRPYLDNTKVNCVSYHSVVIRDFLESLSLNRTTSYTKKIPAAIRTSSKETVRHFLRGLYDTDGFASCSTTKGKYGLKKRLTVGLASTSEQLLKEVQVLLLGFGIVSSRAYYTGNYTKKDGTTNSYWTLHIYGRNARRFFNSIGFGLERKQRILEEAPDTLVDTVDKVPYLHTMLKKMKLKEGMVARGSGRVDKWGSIRRQCGGTLLRENPDSQSGITYNKLLEIINYFKEVDGCEEEIKFLQELLTQNLFFDPITEIWDTHEPTYDICVPEVAEFVANGIVSHNSSITGGMSAYEFYRLTKMDNPGAELGLIAGDPIFVLSIATNEQQAKDTIFAYTKARMESSAYFGAMIERGDIVVQTTEIIHRKKNIIFRAGHSRGAGLVGKNLWGLLMDEVNRFAVEPGATVESSGLALWNNVGKGTTRFKHRSDGGLKIAIGSAWQESDMSDTLWKQVEEGRLDAKEMLCFRLCTWDVNPNYSGREDPQLATFYASDVIGSMRDYEGVRPGAQSDFFNKEIVNMYSVQQPVAQYVQKKIHTGQGVALITEDQAREMRADQYRTFVAVDLYNLQEMDFPNFSYAHADPGLKKDSFGFACGHGEPDPDGKGLIAVIDLVLEWEPELDPTNPKLKIPVNLQDVEENILKISNARHVRRLSFDHWQSGAAIQRLYTQGIITEEVTFSAPIQLAMYETLRHRLDNGLVRLPDPTSSKAAAKLNAELTKLQLLHGRKIDHPKGNSLGCSKDLADCVAAVVYRIAQDERSYGLGQQAGVKIDVLGATKLSEIENKLRGAGFQPGRSASRVPRKWT